MLGVLLDGEDALTFGASTVTYTLASGDRVTAACHKAEGYYPENADRVAINVHGSAVTGIDGLKKHGSQIAHMLGREMIFDDPDRAAHNTFMDIELYDKASGAVFAQARIVEQDGEKFLEPAQMGDVRILVLDGQDTLVWESVDEDLVTKMVDQGFVTPDEALYHEKRSVVTKYVGYGQIPDVTHSLRIPLKPGYKVIVASDGLFDNLTTEEFILRIKGKDAAGIIQVTEQTVLPRMQNAKTIKRETTDRATAGVFSDGFRSEPKPDNLSIAVIEITTLSKHLANIVKFLTATEKETDSEQLSRLVGMAGLSLAIIEVEFPNYTHIDEMRRRVENVAQLADAVDAMDEWLEVAKFSQDCDRDTLLANASRVRAHCIALKEKGVRHPILKEHTLALQSLMQSIGPDECFAYRIRKLSELNDALQATGGNLRTSEIISRAKEIVRMHDLCRAIAPRDLRIFDHRHDVDILRTYLKFIDAQRLAKSGEDDDLLHAGKSVRRLKRVLKKNPAVSPADPASSHNLLPLEVFALKFHRHMQRFLTDNAEDIERRKGGDE